MLRFRDADERALGPNGTGPAQHEAESPDAGDLAERLGVPRSSLSRRASVASRIMLERPPVCIGSTIWAAILLISIGAEGGGDQGSPATFRGCRQ